MKDFLAGELNNIEEAGYTSTNASSKANRVLKSLWKEEMLNFCANNYLASHPTRSDQGCHKGMKTAAMACPPSGLSVVRRTFTRTGTESRQILGMEDAILFSLASMPTAPFLNPFGAEMPSSPMRWPCFDHRWDPAQQSQRWIYKHNDFRDVEEEISYGKMAKGLERCLQEAKNCRFKVIATTALSAWRRCGQAEGDLRPGRKIWCTRHGWRQPCLRFMGKTAAGPTSTAMWWAGSTSSPPPLEKPLEGIRRLYRQQQGDHLLDAQQARPYLFSNTVAPAVVQQPSRYSICFLQLLLCATSGKQHQVFPC